MNGEIWIDKAPHKMDTDLGISIWNIAINNAPYRTGNLRNQIRLTSNSTKTKRIIYYDQDAYYLNYLEAGVGRNKKHKGFIENKTVLQVYSEVFNYLQTGHATFTGIPTIVMRSDVARNYERQILKSNNIDPNTRITASDRALLSKEYIKGLPMGYTMVNGNFYSSRGLAGNKTSYNGRFTTSINTEDGFTMDNLYLSGNKLKSRKDFGGQLH